MRSFHALTLQASAEDLPPEKRLKAGASLLLVAMPSAPNSFLLLVAMPFVTSSFLLLVVRPGTRSSVLAPSVPVAGCNVVLRGASWCLHRMAKAPATVTPGLKASCRAVTTHTHTHTCLSMSQSKGFQGQ